MYQPTILVTGATGNIGRALVQRTIPTGSCQDIGHRAIGPGGSLGGAAGGAGARRGIMPAWFSPRRRRSTEALSYVLT